MSMRKLKGSWMFENGRTAVLAEVDYAAETYSVKPKGDADRGGFVFVNQRLPNGLCGPVAGLIIEAGMFCESQLRGHMAEQAALKRALDKAVAAKAGGAPTWAGSKISNALEKLEAEKHPDRITSPDGVELVKHATYKANTLDAAKALLKGAEVVYNVNPDKGATLTERLMEPERQATMEVSLCGSTHKIEIPRGVDYGTPPPPEEVKDADGSYGPADGQYEMEAAEAREERAP